MYTYKCIIEGNPNDEYKARYSFTPRAIVIVLANTFEDALEKVKKYKNEDIVGVAKIISIQRENKINLF